MRVAICGAGGVGGYYGARLAQAGHDVTFIARGEHLAAMRESGLTIVDADGGFTLGGVNATDDPAGVAPAELVLLAVKTWQLPELMPVLAGLLDDGAAVLPLLNGIETPDLLTDELGAERVLKGLTRIISRISAPGEITHVGVRPTIVFKESDNALSDRSERWRAELEGVGVRAILPDDIDAALWAKFLFVCSVGGVGSVSRSPVGVMRSVPETRALLIRAMEEVYAVGAARGVTLADDLIDRSLAFLDSMPADGSSSLQRDLAAGKRSELDAWTGAVVRLGTESGVPTPVHDLIYRAMLPLELQARGAIQFPR